MSKSSPAFTGERRSSWSFDTQPTSNSSSRSKNDLGGAPWNRPLTRCTLEAAPPKNTTFFSLSFVCHYRWLQSSRIEKLLHIHNINSNLLPSLQILVSSGCSLRLDVFWAVVNAKTSKRLKPAMAKMIPVQWIPQLENPNRTNPQDPNKHPTHHPLPSTWFWSLQCQNHVLPSHPSDLKPAKIIPQQLAVANFCYRSWKPRTPPRRSSEAANNTWPPGKSLRFVDTTSTTSPNITQHNPTSPTKSRCGHLTKSLPEGRFLFLIHQFIPFTSHLCNRLTPVSIDHIWCDNDLQSLSSSSTYHEKLCRIMLELWPTYKHHYKKVWQSIIFKAQKDWCLNLSLILFKDFFEGHSSQTLRFFVQFNCWTLTSTWSSFGHGFSISSWRPVIWCLPKKNQRLNTPKPCSEYLPKKMGITICFFFIMPGDFGSFRNDPHLWQLTHLSSQRKTRCVTWLQVGLLQLKDVFTPWVFPKIMVPPNHEF